MNTPGKWKAEKADINAEFDDVDETRWSVLAYDEDGNGFFVATIENGAPGDTLETEASNARLMAAAKEMLEFIHQVASASSLSLEVLRYRAQRLVGSLDVWPEESELISKGVVDAGDTLRLLCYGDEKSVSYVQIEENATNSICINTIRTKGQLQRLIAALRGDPC